MAGNRDESKPRNYDYTRAKRQASRRAMLNEIATAAGWASWSEYETAVKNGKVSIEKKGEE